MTKVLSASEALVQLTASLAKASAVIQFLSGAQGPDLAPGTLNYGLASAFDHMEVAQELADGFRACLLGKPGGGVQHRSALTESGRDEMPDQSSRAIAGRLADVAGALVYAFERIPEASGGGVQYRGALDRGIRELARLSAELERLSQEASV